MSAHRIVAVIREFFGSDVEGATAELFLQENKIARMGVPASGRLKDLSDLEHLE